MGATSNTSTLLSSSSSSRPQRQRQRGPNNRYGITSVRRVCTTNLKNNRHNVAIATQVLSPKALSSQGSINRRRFRHFGETESDDEEFFRRSKRRALLEKLFYYGASITVILLVMTGIILAVGYMQSEKQRILSRSAVTLAQEQNLGSSNSLTTQEPPSIVLARTTELPPTTTQSMNLSVEARIAPNDEDDDDIDELQILEPPAEILKEIMDARSNGRKGKLLDDEESNHRLPSEVKVLPPDGFTFDGYSFEFPIVRPVATNSTLVESTPRPSVNISIDPVEHDEESLDAPPSASSVNANKEFSLSGFNFSVGNKFSLGNFTGGFGTLSNSDGSGNVDLPVVAKLQTDLFSDEELDSESSASNKSNGRNHPQIPIPTEHDNSYTPRPSSVVHYPDKPNRQKSSYNSRNGNQNHNRHSQEKSKPHSYNTISSPNEETTTTYSNLIEVSTSAPVKLEKFEFKSPGSEITEFKASSPGITDFKTPVPGITDFKFDFTTPSPQVSEYLGLSKPETKFSLQATTNNYDNIDYSHLLTTTPASTGATTDSNHQDNQFSKRTYPNFDSFDSSSASTNTNPFAHLLTPSTSYIGSASPTGALQQFSNYQQPTYNFDTNFDSSFNTPQHSIPSGTIPIDLASSYIQAGNPPKGNSGNYGGGGDSSGSFSYNPTYALASLIQNGGGSGGGSNDPKNPSYNTISQGIHLLNLLSGNIPQHLLNGPDQFQSASHINVQQQQHIAKPEFQIAALTGYGGSSNAFLSGLNSNPSEYLQHAESRSLPSYTNDLHPSKSFSTGNSHVLDQLPSASSSSFSQDIVSKISNYEGTFKGTDPKSQTVELSPTISTALANQPKSLSLDIIPRTAAKEIETSLLDSFSVVGENEALKNGKSITALPAESTSRKKDSADLNSDSPIVDFLRADLDTAGSEMQSNTKKLYDKNYKSHFPKTFDSLSAKPQPFGRKLVIKTIKIKDDFNQKDTKERGLKSGFYF